MGVLGAKMSSKRPFGWILGCFAKVLGQFWEGLGTNLKALVQDELQEAFWMDSGSLWEGLGTVLGAFEKEFGRIWGFCEEVMGRFWKCLASFGPAAAKLINWTPALIREASQCAGVPLPRG